MPVDLYYYTESEWNRLGCGPLPPERDITNKQSTSDGPDGFRQREIVETATQQAMTVNQANNVNANANTREVTVSGKNIKFSARTAKATLAV